MRNTHSLRLLILAGPVLAGLSVSSEAQQSTPPAGEAYKTSPFHRVINEATGRPIPCVCRFRDRDYRVGEAVCMQTHLGILITRCDLHLNNTTWIPTEEPCTVSRAPQSMPPHG